jgi:HD-like signal output (HDOD) protein
MKKSTDSIIDTLRELPVLPDIVTEVIRLTDSTTASLSDVASVIEADPVLVAKVLKLCNSPLFVTRQKIGSLTLALAMIGVREIRNLVIGVKVFDAFQDEASVSLRDSGFLEHATEVGSIARQMRVSLGVDLRGEDYCAGLLHDIGKLALCKKYSNEYISLIETANSSSVSLTELEFEKFGYTHAEASHALLCAWGLPDTICDSALYHHENDRATLESASDPRLASIVCISNIIAQTELIPGSSEYLALMESDELWATLIETNDPKKREELIHSAQTAALDLSPI